jgi:hypothetical protein
MAVPNLTVAELFAQAGLSPCGPVLWRQKVFELRPGVYVVTVGDAGRNHNSNCEVRKRIDAIEDLPKDDRERWVEGQSIIYIGQTTSSLHKRLGQFYRHVHDARSPHRGGQRVLLLKNCERWVYWCPTDQPQKAERVMVDTFCERVRRLPFANNMRPRKPADQESPGSACASAVE